MSDTTRTDEANDRREEWKRQTIAHPTTRKTEPPYLTKKQRRHREELRHQAQQPGLFE